VLIGNFASPNKLFRNRGDGTFEDVSDRFGISELSATHVAWSDVDADGYPDVLLAGTPKGLRFLHNAKGERFEDWTARVGLDSRNGLRAGDGDRRLRQRRRARRLHELRR
jgi:hypothetical protein